MSVTTLLDVIVRYVARKSHPASGVAAGAIQLHTGRPRPTVNRALARLVEQRRLERLGAGRAVTYRVALPTRAGSAASTTALGGDDVAFGDASSPPRTRGSRALAMALAAPLGTRAPVAYQRRFVDGYVPNRTRCCRPTLPRNFSKRHARASSSPPGRTHARSSSSC